MQTTIISGLYWGSMGNNGEENGNYYNGLYRVILRLLKWSEIGVFGFRELVAVLGPKARENNESVLKTSSLGCRGPRCRVKSLRKVR